LYLFILQTTFYTANNILNGLSLKTIIFHVVAFIIGIYFLRSGILLWTKVDEDKSKMTAYTMARLSDEGELRKIDLEDRRLNLELAKINKRVIEKKETDVAPEDVQKKLQSQVYLKLTSELIMSRLDTF